MSYSVQDSHFHNADSICIKGKFPSALHPLRWAAGSVSPLAAGAVTPWPAVFSVQHRCWFPAHQILWGTARGQTGSFHWSCQGFVAISRYNSSEKVLVYFLQCWTRRKIPSLTTHPPVLNKHIRNKVSCGKNSWVCLLILEWVMVAVYYWAAPAVLGMMIEFKMKFHLYHLAN